MTFATLRDRKKGARRLIDIVRSHCSTARSTALLSIDTPALLTNMSIVPNFSSVVFTIKSMNLPTRHRLPVFRALQEASWPVQTRDHRDQPASLCSRLPAAAPLRQHCMQPPSQLPLFHRVQTHSQKQPLPFRRLAKLSDDEAEFFDMLRGVMTLPAPDSTRDRSRADELQRFHLHVTRHPFVVHANFIT